MPCMASNAMPDSKAGKISESGTLAQIKSGKGESAPKRIPVIQSKAVATGYPLLAGPSCHMIQDSCISKLVSPTGTSSRHLSKLLKWQGLEPKPGTATTNRQLGIPCSFGWTQLSLTTTIKFLLSLPLLTLSKPALSLWPLSQGQNLVKHPELFGGPGGPASLEMNESLL